MNRRAFLALVSATPLALKAEPVETVKIPPPITPLNVTRLLRCIAEVETGNDDAKVGHRGERSRYQIREMVWRDRTEGMMGRFDDETPGGIPIIWHTYLTPCFKAACHGWNAERVATKHIAWLRKNLPSDSPYWLYFAWQAGLNRTKAAMRDPKILWMFHAPAKRLDNLYYDKSYAPTNL